MSNLNETIGSRQSFRGAAAQPSRGLARASQRRHAIAAWLILVGIIVPAEIQLSIGGSKFTMGRIAVVLLIVPAIAQLVSGQRRRVLADLAAFAMVIWMVGVTSYTGGVVSAVAEALEFVGGYLVARAFFFENAALQEFVRALKVFTMIAIAAAVVDAISGRWLVHDTIASVLGERLFEATYRGSMIRAKATFDHPILYGTFCALAAAIFFYTEPQRQKRILLIAICFFGCFLSQSSAALMGFLIIAASYNYDRLVKQPWRWILLWSAIGVCTLLIFAVSSHPIGWMISRLTFDPQSGYYRILIWDVAMDQISRAPITGAGFDLLNDDVLDHTVDSVWLVAALRFGIPMIILLAALNVLTFIPVKGRPLIKDQYLRRVCTAFTLILIVYMFTGITVHFWNYMWVFWGVCIGVRASLRERVLRGT